MKFTKTTLARAVVALLITNGGFIPAAYATVADSPKSNSPNTATGAGTLLQKIGIMSTRKLDIKEQFKLSIKEGLILESVEGAAAIAGVQQGDILISINGRDARFGQIEKLPADFPSIIILLVLRANERLPIAVQLSPMYRPVFLK